MPAAGTLREKKRESVQFWLAIVAVSFLFHALLIVGVKRWAKVAIVEPEAIAVELVDPTGSLSPQGEPIVQAVAMKPEAKPQVKPEIKPEAKPQVKSDIQPDLEPETQLESKSKSEPIVQSSISPEVKKVEPTIVPKKERNPTVSSNSSQTKRNDQPPIQSQNNPVSPEKKPEIPSTSQEKLIPPDAERKGITSIISRAGGEPVLSNPGSINGTVNTGSRMAVPIFATLPASEETLPTNFPLPLNAPIRLTVYFCIDSQGNAICDPHLDTNAMKGVVQSLNLNSSQRDQLDIFVSNLIKSTKFPKPSLKSDVSPDKIDGSEWSVVLEISGQ